MKTKRIGIFTVDESIESAEEVWTKLTEMFSGGRNWVPRYSEFISTVGKNFRSGSRFTAIALFDGSREDMWLENWEPERMTCSMAFANLDKPAHEWLKLSVLHEKNNRFEVEVIVTDTGVYERIMGAAEARLSHYFSISRCPVAAKSWTNV